MTLTEYVPGQNASTERDEMRNTHEESAQRKVLCLKQFIRDYKKTKAQNGMKFKEEVDAIINSLCFKSRSELDEFFRLKNAKKMQGCSDGIFKLRINQASRLLFYYAEYEGETYICLHGISTDHDYQGDLAANRMLSENIAPWVIQSEEEYNESELKKPIYDAHTFLPILSEKQTEVTRARLPIIINGSAGSGKTCIAIELYKQYHELFPEKSILYVTKNFALVDFVREKLQHNNIPSPDCKAFSELDVENKDKKRLLDHEDFKSFWESLGTTNHISIEEFNLCLNSIIKGDAALLESGKKCIDVNILENKIKHEGLDVDYNSVWMLYQKYEAFLERRNLQDDNDLARRLNNRGANVDFLMIDESQDFSNLQMQALLSMCRGKDYVLLGDKNQVVAASTFDFGAFISDMKHRQNVTCSKTNLKNTYRSGQLIIDYINNLSDVRKAKIGLQDQDDDEKEQSMRCEFDEDRPPIVVSNKDNIQKLISEASNASNCAIIVDSEERKKELQTELDVRDDESNIFTVEEAKGLEFPVCVLYKFVGSNRKKFDDIQNGLAKRKTIYRIVFNKFYVSCTRAEDRLIICESEDVVRDFEHMLFKGIESPQRIDEVLDYLSTSAESWLSAALSLYENKNYEMAARYFRKYENCPDAVYTDEYEKYKTLCEAHINARTSNDPQVLKECAWTLFDDEPEEAKRILDKIRNQIDFSSEDKYNELILNIRIGGQYGHKVTAAELLETIRKHPIFESHIKYFIDNQVLMESVERINNILEEV